MCRLNPDPGPCSAESPRCLCFCPFFQAPPPPPPEEEARPIAAVPLGWLILDEQSTSQPAPWIIFVVTLILQVALFLAFFLVFRAEAEDIPREVLKYRRVLIRAAQSDLGVHAPVATLAAQVHTESRWREDAQSPAGAQGLAQIMPGTEAWLGEIRPDLGPADAWSPAWALRAMVAYDAWLLARIRAATERDRWQMALASYNGGLGWTIKDRALAARGGLDPGRWDGHVATVNAGRGSRAWRENRDYPQRVRKFEPLYESWGPGVLR